MLVLSRKKGEGIHIGSSIQVKVLEIRGGHVRLGLQGPPDTPIHRAEVYWRIASEQKGRSAVGGAVAPLQRSTSAPRPNTRRILVVDDSEIECRLAGALLDQDSFQIECAENGLQALERIEQAPFDLLLTDLVMPEMNGLELLRNCRRHHPEMPVVLMTAFGSEAMAVKALEQGAASYVPKALRAAKLRGVVQQVLSRANSLHAQQQMMGCLSNLQCTFELENDAELLEHVVQFVEGSLRALPVGDSTTRLRVGVALQEALLNAMYHGNLEITETEYAEAEQDHALEQLVAHRRSQPPYRERRILLDVKLLKKGVRFVVRDEGSGFPVCDLDATDNPANFDNGRFRGVTLMRAFMDEMVFNSAGNEVRLSKRSESRAFKPGVDASA